MDGLPETALLYLCSIAGSVFIFYLLSDLILNLEVEHASDNPSSFFKTKELLSKSRRVVVRSIYALPPCFTFLMLSLYSNALVVALFDFIKQSLLGMASPSVKSAAGAILDAVPHATYPLFVLGAALLLFAPVLRTPFVWVAKLLLRASGTRLRSDKISRDIAGKLFSRYQNDFAQAEGALNAAFHVDTPLPPEMASSDNVEKLAYKILYLKSTNFSEEDLDAGVNSIAERIGVSPYVSSPSGGIVNVFFLPALLFYVIVCFLYVLAVPAMSDFVSRPSILHFLQPIEWPHPNKRDILAVSLAQRTFSFVLPLAIGFYGYSTRRRFAVNEAALRSFSLVASFQFLLSFTVNLMFNTILIARSQTGDFSGVVISFYSINVWVEIILYSLTPVIALATAIILSKMRLHLVVTIVFVCLVSAVAFDLSQYFYEIISTRRGYNWHELFLGLFLAGSYFVAGALINDLTLISIALSPNSRPRQPVNLEGGADLGAAGRVEP